MAYGSGGELGHVDKLVLRRVWAGGERDASALGRGKRKAGAGHTGEGSGHREGEGDGELGRLAFGPEGEEGSFPFFYKFSKLNSNQIQILLKF